MKSASPRELKRAKSAVASTGAGTAWSIAAWIVQRPSPESDTRPANAERDGSFASAAAVAWARSMPRRIWSGEGGLFSHGRPACAGPAASSAPSAAATSKPRGCAPLMA